jgi:hypothetical protein
MITCGRCDKKIDSIAEMGDHIFKTGHQEYRTSDGIELPRTINISLMAGPKACVDCGKKFTNNYHYCEHIVITGHENIGMHTYAKKQKIELDELEQQWFYGRPDIPYTRKPQAGQEGNLLVTCPECKKEYKSVYFMDTDFDKWKRPDTQTLVITCSLCGVTSNTPNQNIRLRQKVYEERIERLEDQLRRYKEKYGEL